MSTDELLALVLRLPREERARLTEELLESFDEPDEAGLPEAWAAELSRRSRELAEGRVEAVDWTTAREELQRELGSRRARRAAS